MDRDNAISRGDYLRPWEFIVETKFVDSQFPTLYSTCDQIPRAQLWLTVETRRTRISNSNYVFISDEQHKYRVYGIQSCVQTSTPNNPKFLSSLALSLLFNEGTMERRRKKSEKKLRNIMYVDSSIEKKCTRLFSREEGVIAFSRMVVRVPVTRVER